MRLAENQNDLSKSMKTLRIHCGEHGHHERFHAIHLIILILSQAIVLLTMPQNEYTVYLGTKETEHRNVQFYWASAIDVHHQNSIAAF